MELTAKQRDAMDVLASKEATHIMLFGGSRSGKTFLLVRAVIMRALLAPKSRHAILRFRFNHVKASIIHDTFPKVMTLCFPGVSYKLDKTDWFATLPNDSQVWFGGLDDKERTEKILGQEHATIYLNECSQIPFSSRNLAITRLAQLVPKVIDGKTAGVLIPKMYYDCNPPSKAHWSYKLFIEHQDPETRMPLPHPGRYAHFRLNPADNLTNLPSGYIETLESLPARLRKRFIDGEFADANPNALWNIEWFDSWRRIADLPEMQRVVVAVDPSGSGDKDNTDNDEIGIVVAGLGVDGNGYLLEDLTIKAGPATWGKVATVAYERHKADRVVAEGNFGGAMVEHVIQTARPHTPFKKVTASRGKVVRAEPVASLGEQGRIRHAGYFPELEDELCSFTTTGYVGERSPNRGDAYVWAFTELLGGIVSDSSVFDEEIEYDMRYVV